MSRAADVIPSAVNAHGLLREDMLLCCNGGGDVNRTKARSRREDHEIDILEIDDLLIAIKAAENAIIPNCNACRRDEFALDLFVVFLAQRVTRGLRFSDINVSHRDDPHIWIRHQCVVRGA